jgi:hypothetical protein
MTKRLPFVVCRRHGVSVPKPPVVLMTLLMSVVSVGWLVRETALQAASVTTVSKAIEFKCTDSEAKIKAKQGAAVTFGSAAFYVGYEQVPGGGKDARMIRFDQGKMTWCKSNYEVSPEDSTGYGLIGDGGNMLYGVFGTTGTQGSTRQDFRRFADRGWLSGYGIGSGAKVAVIARINPETGEIANATFLNALLPDGTSNSVFVNGLTWKGNSLVVKANTASFPRGADRAMLTCTSQSPFTYTVEFTEDLQTAVKTMAPGCQ